MAKQSLASMSVEALLKLRNDIGDALSRRAETLKDELRSLGEDYSEVGRIALRGKGARGKKKSSVAPKYRHPETGETWAGRGARPRWLAAEIKNGKSPDDFLIGKEGAPAKRRGRPKKKVARKMAVAA